MRFTTGARNPYPVRLSRARSGISFDLIHFTDLRAEAAQLVALVRQHRPHAERDPRGLDSGQGDRWVAGEIGRVSP